MLGGEVLAEWQAGLDDLFALIAGRFARVEPRRLAFAYVRGLLAPLERRNGWTIADHAGRRSPNAVQEMLYSPCWDPHLVRDDIRGYLVEHLGDPDGVLIADDTRPGTRRRPGSEPVSPALPGAPFCCPRPGWRPCRAPGARNCRRRGRGVIHEGHTPLGTGAADEPDLTLFTDREDRSPTLSRDRLTW